MVLINVLTHSRYSTSIWWWIDLILWYCHWLIKVILLVEAYGHDGKRYQNIVACPVVDLWSFTSWEKNVQQTMWNYNPWRQRGIRESAQNLGSQDLAQTHDSSPNSLVGPGWIFSPVSIIDHISTISVLLSSWAVANLKDLIRFESILRP